MSVLGTAFGPVKQAGKFFATVGKEAMSDRGLSGAKKAASHMWSGGSDLVRSRTSVRAAQATRLMGGNDQDVFNVLKQGAKSFGNASGGASTKSGVNMAKATSKSYLNNLDKDLSAKIASENFMTGPAKAMTAAGGYQGYRKLRDPDRNIPLVPFI